MSRSLKVLLAGETWITHTVHIKGIDHFTQSGYGEGARWVKAAIESAGHCFEHVPNHLAGATFPALAEHLDQYDVIILSDIGSNTLLLHSDTAERSLITPNRLTAIEEFVARGGGLLMIGGYMSFEGIEGKARYAGTPVETALPVTMFAGTDDRRERPEGFRPRATAVGEEHPVLRGLPREFPVMLFHNAVEAKPNARVLLEHEGAPILAVGEYGRGRSAAFTPDAAPHGAPPDFLDWEHFNSFWQQLIAWLSGNDSPA